MQLLQSLAVFCVLYSLFCAAVVFHLVACFFVFIFLLADAKYRALKMSFTLNSSTYATMLFRELMKCSTEVGHHKNLSDEFVKQSEENETQAGGAGKQEE